MAKIPGIGRRAGFRFKPMAPVGGLPGIRPEEESFLRRVGGGALSTFITVGETFDAPLQAIRTTMLALKDILREGGTDKIDDIFKSFVPFRRKVFGQDNIVLPQWQEVLEETGFYEAMGIESRWVKGGVALGIGITGDFLVLPSMFSLTKAGREAFKGAKGAAKLAETWAEQAAKGQRALFQWPLLRRMVGQEVTIAGEKVVSVTGGVGAKLREAVKKMIRVGPGGKVVARSAKEVSEAGELGAQGASDLMKHFSAGLHALTTGDPYTAAKAVDGAEMIGGIPAFLRPWHTPDFSHITALRGGAFDITDGLAAETRRMVEAVTVAAAKDPQRAERFLTPVVKAIENAARSLDDAYDALVYHLPTGARGRAHPYWRGGQMMAEMLGERLGLPVMTLNEAAKAGAKGKNLLYFGMTVGPLRNTVKGPRVMIEKLLKAGGQVRQVGFSYWDNPAQVILRKPRTFYSPAEVAALGQLYDMANDLEAIQALRSGAGEDFIRQVSALAENKEMFRKVMEESAEGLSPMEEILQGIHKTYRQQYLDEKSVGAPLANWNEADTVTAYQAHVMTGDGAKYWGNLNRAGAKAAPIWRQILEVTGETPQTILRRTSRTVENFTPWEKVPPRINDLIRGIVDPETIASFESLGVPNEFLSIFDSGIPGGAAGFGYHQSMLTRTSVFRNMSVEEVNALVRGLGGPEKFYVDDAFAALAIRTQRHHHFMAAARGLHDLADKVGIPIESVPTDLMPKYAEVRMLNDMRKNLGKGAVVFEKDVANAIIKHHEFMAGEYATSGFWRAYDGINSFLKGWTLAPFPAYHIRNTGSDTWRAITQADVAVQDLPRRIRQANQIMFGEGDFAIEVLGGKSIMASSIRDQLKNSMSKVVGFIGGEIGDPDQMMMKATRQAWTNKKTAARLLSGEWKSPIIRAKEGIYEYWSGITEAHKAGVTRTQKFLNTVQAVFDPKVFPVNRLGRAYARRWETTIRSAVAIDQIAKGAKVTSAVKWASKWLIDYGDLTLWEKEWGKRGMWFYSWFRHNTPLVVESLFRKPYIYTSMLKAQQTTQRAMGSEEEEAILPEFIKDNFYIRWPSKNKDLPAYLYGLGLPEEDVFRLMQIDEGVWGILRKLVSQMPPPAKIILEQTTGKDMFFDTAVDEYRTAWSYLRHLPDPVKRVLNFYEYETKAGQKRYRMNPYALYYLRQFRIFTEFHRATDERKTALQRFLNTMTGAKVASLDIEFWARAKLSKERDKVLEEAYKRGELEQFRRYYPQEQMKDVLSEEVAEALKMY